MRHHDYECDWCHARQPADHDGDFPQGWTEYQGEDLCNACLTTLNRHKSAAVNAARAERSAAAPKQ